jgi:hypothetical protein
MDEVRLAEFDRMTAPEPRARRDDPATSHEAAAKAAGFAVNHRNRIMAVLTVDGLTIKEIAELLGDIDHVAAARRMPELKDLGLAEPTTERRGGCRVWRRTARANP